MDATVVALIGAGVTGLGGFAAVLKVFADSKATRRANDTSVAGLASTLNASAKDWVDYIDGKFDKVSDELDKVSGDFSAFKTASAARDAARAVLHQAHQRWDFTMKDKLQTVTGEPIADPPPLDLIE